jgi:hypothetical protein
MYKVIQLIIQLYAVYQLYGYMGSLSPDDAGRVRQFLLNLYMKFIYIVQLIGWEYAKGIEALAITLVTTVWSKLSSGKGLSIENIPYAAVTFAITYSTNTKLKNLVKTINSVNTSVWGRFSGRSFKSGRDAQQAICAMIAWLIASLNGSSALLVREITGDVRESYRLRSLTRNQLLTLGARQTGVHLPQAITNGTNLQQAPRQANQRQANQRQSPRQANQRQAPRQANQRRMTVFTRSSPANNAARRQARLRRFV